MCISIIFIGATRLRSNWFFCDPRTQPFSPTPPKTKSETAITRKLKIYKAAVYAKFITFSICAQREKNLCAIIPYMLCLKLKTLKISKYIVYVNMHLRNKKYSLKTQSKNIYFHHYSKQSCINI